MAGTAAPVMPAGFLQAQDAAPAPPVPGQGYPIWPSNIRHPGRSARRACRAGTQQPPAEVARPDPGSALRAVRDDVPDMRWPSLPVEAAAAFLAR